MCMFYFLISKGDGSFCFLFCYRPIEIPPQQPRHRLLSHHRQPIVLADGQVTRWSPIGEEAHGVAFLLGGVVDQSPLLQGLVDMGGVETFQWVTGLVLLEYLAEEGKLTLFLVGRDIIAIGIDVTKQGNI
ncbi:hypothetical protein HMPREF9008_03890 [Parabacteroides sp. 20_3]|nr:hypothetical protein HMPREF9008_03890 [Parabacteroides sp. 20_3]